MNTILAISLFFHLTATVIWVGGLMMTIILIWPEMQRTLQDSSFLYQLSNRLRRRFISLSNFSLAMLVVTGLVQMSLHPDYNGLMNFSNAWSRIILFKHLALLGMIICGGLIQYSVSPALERTSLLIKHGKEGDQVWSRLQRRERWLTGINTLLGVAVLGFSAWAGTL